jgi:hypothetical protein
MSASIGAYTARTLNAVINTSPATVVTFGDECRRITRARTVKGLLQVRALNGQWFVPPNDSRVEVRS